MVVPEQMILKYIDNKHKELYNKYRAHSYVSNNKALRWCPAPGCEKVAEC